MTTEYYDPAKGISRYVSDPSALRAVDDWHDREVISLQHTRPQRAYIYDAASLRSDDGTNVIKPRIKSSADPGRWILVQATSSGGVTFLTLSDTPGSYAGMGARSVRVNPGETGLEFSAVGGGCNECLYSDPDPTNWLDQRQPETVEQALQSAFEALYQHLGFPLTAVAPVGTGCTFADDPAHWVAGAYPTSVTDALQSLSENLFNHLGFTVTTNALGQGCAPYADNPAYWTGGIVAPTILEAIQSMVDDLAAHIGAPIRVLPGECMVDCEYLDDPATWQLATPPKSTLAALQSIARELAAHKGGTIPPVQTPKGCPYTGDASIWTGSVLPNTLLAAAQALAAELYAHLSVVIPNTGFAGGCAVFLDTPNNWQLGEPPLTLLEATQAMAAKFAAHLTRPLVSLDTNLFINLGDTPLAYSGQAGKGVLVNTAENAMEFASLDWHNAAPEFVIGSADKTPPDTIHDVSDPSFLHENGVNDGIANAMAVANSVGGGLMHIRKGSYNTDQKYDITANLRVQGAGITTTLIRQTDQNPTGANWLFNFQGDSSGLENLGVIAPPLSSGSPEYVVKLEGRASQISDVGIFGSGTSVVTSGYVFVTGDNTCIGRLFVAADGGDLLTFSGAANFSVRESLLYAVGGGFCIVLDNSLDGTVSGNFFFESNQFSQAMRIAHEADQAKNLRILGNLIQGGVKIEATGASALEHLIFQQNNVEMYGFGGMTIHDAGGVLRNSQITNNTFKRIYTGTTAIQAITGKGGFRNKYDNNTFELSDRDQARAIELTSEVNSTACDNIIHGDGINQGGVRLISCHGTKADDNEISLEGLSTAALAADGAINIYYGSHNSARHNTILVAAAYGKAIRVEGDASTRFINVSTNDLYMTAGGVPVVGQVKGIEVVGGGGSAPTKLALNGNTIDASSTSVVAIDAPDNSIKGTCGLNVISGTLSTPLNLGTGILVGINDTT